MTEEPTLADFLGGDDSESEGDGESDAERDSDDGGTLEDAEGSIESVDSEDEEVEDVGEEVDSEDEEVENVGEEVEDDSTGEGERPEGTPAVSTYAWGAYDCSSCGASAERVWRDAEEFVCDSCKDW